MAQDLSASHDSRTSRTRSFPLRGAPEAELLHWRDRCIPRHSSYRDRHMARVTLSLWYFLGRHWAELDSTYVFDGVRGALIREHISDLPQPVTNEIDPAVEVEIIGLVKRQWIPKVVATSSDPRIKAAAQVSHDVLNYRLKQLLWPQKRTQIALNYAVLGTSLVHTAWDKTYLDLRTVGAPSVVFCVGCGNRLYSPEIPVDTLRSMNAGAPLYNLESAEELPLDESFTDEDSVPIAQARLRHCPFCESPRNLIPGASKVTPEEIEASRSGAGPTDPFGRPLVIDEPRGNSNLEVDLPFEYYPEDGGIRKTPDTLRRHGRRKIRSLDWLEERVPGCADYIAPDGPNELLEDDPLLGTYGSISQWTSGYDASLLDDHVNVDEVWEEPTMRNPRGRYILCTKSRCLIDEDLLLEESVEDEDGPETIYVPRVRESSARYKIRPTEFWGTTLVEYGISPQNRLNGLDAQTIEQRQLLGSPNIAMPPGMWISGPAFDDSYGMAKILFFKPDPLHPEITKPEFFGGVPIDEAWFSERDRIQADIKKQLGPPDVKMGGGVKNVGTTSGLQLVNEVYDAQTSLREEELTQSISQAWSHMQQLQWVLRTDPETYRVLGPDGAWKQDQYTRTRLRGQYEVEIEKQSFISKSIYQSEAVREAMADGLYVADSPAARKKILEYRNLPTDVNEDTNNQIEQANRHWTDFVDHGIVRVQDSIDAPSIHYDILGKFLMSDEGQRIAREVGWDDIRRQIAGWEKDLQRIQLLGSMSEDFYGGRLAPAEAETAYARAQEDYQKQLDLHGQQSAIIAEAKSIPPAPGTAPSAAQAPPPPTPPPPPVFLPPLLQDQILLVWQKRLGAATPPAPNVAPSSPDSLPGEPKTMVTPETYMQFRALVDAYRLSMLSPVPAPGAMGAMGAPAGPAPAGAPPGGPPPAPATTAPLPEGGPN